MKAHASRNVKVSPVLMIGPFTVAAQLRGISDFCMDLFDEPEMITQLLDIVVESEIVYLKEQEKILGSLESILIGDDIAGFVSETQFREWVMPTYQKIYAPFPKTKKWLHNDANAAHLAGAFADCGFELWNLGDCVDMIKACSDARNEVTVVGNLSPVECLKNGTEKSVREAANALIDRFAGNSRFVLSAGGYISYGTPLENVRAMLQSAQAH
jgi:uroporphyrinogen-III decarboxylase